MAFTTYVVQDNPFGRGPVGLWSQLWQFFPCPHSNSCLVVLRHLTSQ